MVSGPSFGCLLCRLRRDYNKDEGGSVRGRLLLIIFRRVYALFIFLLANTSIF